jgi:hypothetical protein
VYHCYGPERQSIGVNNGEDNSTRTECALPVQRKRRKYHRRPKVDQNAPERPNSAYVTFSNQVREELRDQNLSFTQLAKLVGNSWQKLDSIQKDRYIAQARTAKGIYLDKLLIYQKTEEYQAYVRYISDFKTETSKEGETKSLARAAHKQSLALHWRWSIYPGIAHHHQWDLKVMLLMHFSHCPVRIPGIHLSFLGEGSGHCHVWCRPLECGLQVMNDPQCES